MKRTFALALVMSILVLGALPAGAAPGTIHRITDRNPPGEEHPMHGSISLSRLAFGLMAGLTVILLGGLEAGIALHILNNLVAFAVAIFFFAAISRSPVTHLLHQRPPIGLRPIGGHSSAPQRKAAGPPS